ncbi:class I SAM-dependent methyltransferase [Anthocerotibacter panamensis]|uniref:class I SAM-dependent methyltransferase n=1 Tax=Anthocerotibacter panamensis TaxID=2857077 RepID=UPI001C4075E2|nr:methyltransferase domain-containing protein [Anthocerotibacter panamensis]
MPDRDFGKDAPQFSPEMYRDLDSSLGSRRSAQEILPLLFQLIPPARSIIDVGCGVGSWLAILQEMGVEDVLGVDTPFIERTYLKIPENRFYPLDLREPLRLERTFDLALCLEVAQDLPEGVAADFVASLTRLAPVVLFSSAIPYQAGAGTGRINQQWPIYWVEHFNRQGYVVIDSLRSQIWQNENVEWWYAQNLLLYVQEDYLAAHPPLLEAQKRTCLNQLSLVHPRRFLMDTVLRTVVSSLPTAFSTALKRRLGKPVNDYEHF